MITIEPSDQRLIDAMERAGYRVQCDELSNGAFRVRVRSQVRTVRYNVHTASNRSNGMAIIRAWLKWRQAIDAGAIPERIEVPRLGDRSLPRQRMVIVPRSPVVAPGPPLNLPIGRRGLVARLLGRIGERRR